jgi:hypothetical protein
MKTKKYTWPKGMKFMTKLPTLTRTLKTPKKNIIVEEKVKELKDFSPTWCCRFHPVNWWHEVGCPHREWTKEELQEALNNAKQSNAYLVYLLGRGDNK